MATGRDDALAGFTKFAFSDGRWTRPVYRLGSGPAVIVIHEIPGLHPAVLDFARDVAAEGMTVFCPSLFGEPGKPVSDFYINTVILKLACVGREFSIWAAGRSSPFVDWLRALARQAHAECGGKGVGAVGMCFTGGFALAMMTEPSVVAPVLAEPSLPAGRKHGAALDCSPAELAVAKARMEAEDLLLLALRFERDKLSPCARFQTLERELGRRAELHTLPDAAARQGTGRAPHSVLTTHLNRDDPDGETMKVHRRVLDFFKERTRA
ncbi:dienelactone hydrolase family protein [Caulobacter sp. UNC279MFTsu5.1]|uniref:dienelactone hydrolase family protein n=1 Tax=Caulobacter sp. UNC279MFTsu5.1 TaxID=1502775 RepID=UPI000377913A|nr:dienelactone hydrolase family protein [Caulobacter sp. UNC279MFTsu5.1]SFK09035.1 Dienelactone hydrolase family protein [Caulobacter sp. UNC279MFTsu5.1]